MTEKNELPITSWQRSNISPEMKLDVTGSIVGSNMLPPKIVFTWPQTKGPIMTINNDGKITLGEDADPTEAAAACIEAMDGMIQNLISNAAQKERAAIVAWLLMLKDLYTSRGQDSYVALEDIAHNIERGEHLEQEA